MMKKMLLIFVLALVGLMGFACAAGTVSHNASKITPGNFSGGNFTFQNNIFVNNKLGIGVLNPSQKLSIAGDAGITGYASAGSYVSVPNMCIGNSCKTSWPNGIWNSRVPANNTLTALGSYTSDGWNDVSISVGSDGLPIVAYTNGTALLVVKCGSMDCSSNNIASVVDTGITDAGSNNFLVIGAGGMPEIAYKKGTALKLVSCGNAACSAGNTIVTVDQNLTGGYEGDNPSLTIAPDGTPAISYCTDGTRGYLKYVKCGDSNCSSGNKISIVDSTNWNTDTSIAIGTDGLPIISYYDYTSYNLDVAHCSDISNCSTGHVTITVIDSTGDVGSGNSIAIGSDGLSIISYVDNTNTRLRVAKCTTITCSASTKTSVDSTSVAGWTSIAVASDGLPAVAYSSNGYYLHVAKCTASDCTGTSTITQLSQKSNSQSIAVGSDGLPIVLFGFSGSDKLFKVTHCGSPSCLPFWTRR